MKWLITTGFHSLIVPSISNRKQSLSNLVVVDTFVAAFSRYLVATAFAFAVFPLHLLILHYLFVRCEFVIYCIEMFLVGSMFRERFYATILACRLLVNLLAFVNSSLVL